MITKIELVPRKELHSDYEEHRAINLKIFSDFKASLQEFDPEVKLSIMTLMNEEILHASDYSDVPYGSTTLEKSGCAVFCLEQGLRMKGFNVNIADLAEEVYKKGYYESGKGTYHNLFDEYKNGFCTRCSSYKEVFRSLEEKHILTILVENKKYYNNGSKTGRHFVNVVGKMKDYLIIDDSNTYNHTIKLSKDVFDATEVAWRWN